ncbi:unnamed protein product [Cochlearia groenlandica]
MFLGGDIEEQKKGKYILIHGDGDDDSELGLFYKPLPCFGFGIGWFSFLLGFVFPIAWYFATFLYLTNYYRRDPRERSGLAASAIAALIFTVALAITVLVLSSYGFVHYFDRRSAGLAIVSLNGRHLFGLPIKVNWAYATGQREDTSSHFNIFVGDLSPEVTDAALFENRTVKRLWLCFLPQSAEDGRDLSNEEAPENNPQYTTVYVGNLAPEVTQLDLHRLFHALGAGVIEVVRVQRDKGFGFVRFNTHEKAALAIQMGNSQPFLFSRHIN